MADTLASLTTLVSADLRDPSNLTFGAPVVGELINAALAEIGRLCPRLFREDVTPVAGQLDYVLQSTLWAAGNPLIEPVRVEVWDKSQTPNRFVGKLRSASGEYENVSTAGWRFWGGQLSITNHQYDVLDPSVHVMRVWGYSPYPQLVSASPNSIDLPAEHHYALRDYCRVEALKTLLADRELFSQWQTHDNNTDVTPAGLYQMLNLATQAWRSRARALMTLREAS